MLVRTVHCTGNNEETRSRELGELQNACLESPKEHAGKENETENPDFTKINGLFLHRTRQMAE